MIFSRSIVDGCVVTFSGEKIVRASNRTKNIVGVFKSARQITLRPVEDFDHVMHFDIPECVQVKGEVLVMRTRRKK